MLIAFAMIERRVAEPMLPLGLFRGRAFTGVQLAAFAVSASLFALFLYLTLYLQDYLGYSPLQAGLRYLPMTLAPFLVAPRRGRPDGAGAGARSCMAIGLAGVGGGLMLMSGSTPSSGWTALLPGFIRRRDRRRPAQPGDRRRRASAWCRRSAAEWRPGSTTRSVRSASRSAWPRGARSSSAAAPTRSTP